MNNNKSRRQLVTNCSLVTSHTIPFLNFAFVRKALRSYDELRVCAFHFVDRSVICNSASRSSSEIADYMEIPYMILALAAAAYTGRFCFKVWGAAKASAYTSYKHTNSFPKDHHSGGFKNPMTKKEAALILGIGENDAKAKVKEAHKRLIFKNHPDAGGSVYLAAKINHAKDTLLKKNANSAD